MRLDACIATDEHPARRVVGDSVLNLDLPVVDARVDDLETRQHVIGGVEHLIFGHARTFQVLLQHERDLAFGTWLDQRSEEHTSELQSLMRISYAVFCLKKKKNTQKQNTTNHHN